MSNRDCVRTNLNKENDGPVHSETDALMTEGKPQGSLRDRLAGILKHENPVGMTVLVISTLNVFFALFGSDLQLAFFDKSADTAFQIGFIVSLVLFLTEMIVTILVDENYKWSFFFWLDVIATASLCLDVPWIIDPIYAFLFDAKTHRSSHAGTTAARAGRAGRIGARTGRVTRILRINRMIRVVKMSDVFAYFQKDKRNEDDDADSNMGAPPSQESSPQRRPSKSPKIEASRLSKTLSDSNTRKVVVSILLILTVQPLLMPDEEDNTAAAGLPMLFYFGSSHTKQSCDQQGWDFPCSKLNIAGNKPEKGWLTAEGWEKLLWVYKQSYKGTYLSGESFERQLLSLEVPDLEGGGRVQPLNKISSTDGGWVSHPECVSCSFTHTLVIEPIEKMVQIIKQLARDPLKRPQVTDSDEVATSKKNKNESKLETSMLENTILKIGGLMQLGFGQAGAEIIAQNMSSEGGSLDLLIPGRKVYGVYGFADIVNFQDITECLSEEVMVFVNKIARIVHHCVNEWGGTTNKNIGDSFFVVWLVDDEEERDVADNKSLSRTSVLGIGKNAQTDTAVKKVKELCNRSLFSFLKILAEFGRASDLATYAKHPKIIPRFGAGYNVHINLGLHCGWAIQGVIGSKFKIDASYFSPHVNLAARLLGATRHFGVNILFSDEFQSNLCAQAQSRCRQVDCVVLKGTHCPIKIFTFDNIRHAFEGIQIVPPKLGKFHPPDDASETSENVDWMFMVDQDIAMMQRGITVEFQGMWRQALDNYLRGEWGKAEEFARKCLMVMPEDGPSLQLLNYLKSLDGVPPPDWQGYRNMQMK
ncbi:adenylate and guanylate cyclase catalytic domain-containing protein [Toxoplasma gondii VEG]|uniref:Adenylate and guanylate cyclase catalytic domain-containing protein n=1 Tax=Toxoplasma gondii (strain ATCC 50861 / VEG) TaxID=432359 RepID=V4ZKN3_TOXGV|nr:adenylate and guanylate cyclase catalytic domain-containing protein [Toxoplasma gondii VEG]